MKKITYFLASIVAVMMFLGFSMGVVQAGLCELPDFASATFSNSTVINNPYFPLIPGTTFVYEPLPNEDNVVDTVEVTFNTKWITVGEMEVECRVVHDFETVNDVLSEDTLDWYAQDDAGNVWYCGEDTKELDPDGNVISTAGSWEAGVDGALPGYIMPAEVNLKPGTCYQQEFYEDVAEDEAKVMRLNAKADLENGDSYEDCLETKEWSPLELGAIEQKIYGRDVGLVLNFEHQGKRVRNELISVSP